MTTKRMTALLLLSLWLALATVEAMRVALGRERLWTAWYGLVPLLVPSRLLLGPTSGRGRTVPTNVMKMHVT